MRIFFITTIIFVYFTTNSPAQVFKQNAALIKQIDSMFKDDQFWRKEFIKVQRKEKSAYSDETIQSKCTETDSINELKAKAIIKKYGYPGYNLVGESSNDFWAIVQHCDDDVPFQEHVLVLLKNEVDKNNASKENYALLTDRVLVGKNQKQIYGTQVRTDPKTHKAAPFPLKYPKEVNKLRKQMGMEPLEKYLKSFE
ncbi:MAG TPA: DUF6624 domain-containing protein [Mucilaginibacter sp.]|nr:DUF6624 domain-containing protein [Mucilaginibacter sp.]